MKITVLACVGLLAVLVAGLVGLHLWLIDGLDGWLWSRVLTEDTQYTPAYTDTGFRRVRVGMSETEALSLLGPPQKRWQIDHRSTGGPDTGGPDIGERWSFSPGDTNFRCRVLLFRKGRVVEKHAEFYVD
jgi:hypothetical protein